MTAVLDVRDLRIGFRQDGQVVPAVKGVCFSVGKGETVALVGESGAGKSATAMAVVGLLPEHAQVTGSVKLQGKQLVGLDDDAMSQVRGRVIGTITAKQVRLFGTAYVDGDITHEQLSVETGAFFQGRSLKFQRPAPVALAAPEPEAQTA